MANHPEMCCCTACKPTSAPMPPEPSVLWHSVVVHDERGVEHRQSMGEPHEVEGSSIWVDVPAGATVILRHLA